MEFNELKELNLDANEIKVYLSCLKLGSSKVNEIARMSELIRTTAYGVLKSLIEKGLISVVIKDNIKYFQAVNPKQLIDILDEKKKKINDILPNLENLQKFSPNKHKIEFFEGKNGLKTVINDLVRYPNETILIFGSYSKFIKFSEPFANEYFRKRKERNIKVKAIIPFNEEEIYAKKKDKEQLRETRFIDILDPNSSCYIYKNKVAFVSFEDDNLRGIIVDDNEISNLQRVFYNNLWKIAKK